jgi:hypothetical protein
MARSNGNAAVVDTPADTPADADVDAVVNAPVVDTPTPDVPAQADAPTHAQSPAEARRARAAAQAKNAGPPKFTPDDGLEWQDTRTGGQVCVCNSAPNRDGATFLYLVYRKNGREIATPLSVIDDAMEVGLI